MSGYDALGICLSSMFYMLARRWFDWYEEDEKWVAVVSRLPRVFSALALLTGHRLRRSSPFDYPLPSPSSCL